MPSSTEAEILRIVRCPPHTLNKFNWLCVLECGGISLEINLPRKSLFLFLFCEWANLHSQYVIFYFFQF